MADRPKQNSQSTPAPGTVAPATRDAAELGLRSVDAVASMAQQNIETMLTVAHGAVQGFEAIMTELVAYSRDSFERTTSAATAMTAVTAPGDLLKMQADFARQQTEAAMAEMTKLSQMMIKTVGESLAVSRDGAKARGGDQ